MERLMPFRYHADFRRLICRRRRSLAFEYKIISSAIRKGTHFGCLCDWRRGWDSNPRVVAHKLISSQPRYDRFDTSPQGVPKRSISLKPANRQGGNPAPENENGSLKWGGRCMIPESRRNASAVWRMDIPHAKYKPISRKKG